MSERANLNHRYFLKYLLMAVICFAMAGYFYYDGTIGYPKRFEYLEAYESRPEFYQAESKAEWYKFAASQGWPEEIPSSKEEIQNDIEGQFFFMNITLAIATVILLFYLSGLFSWIRKVHIEATPDELRPSWQKPIPMSSISRIDKTKFEQKGIIRIYHDSKQVFVFDDMKFERQPMGVILGWIEDKLPDDKIVGGKRESAKGTATGKEDPSSPETDAATS